MIRKVGSIVVVTASTVLGNYEVRRPGSWLANAEGIKFMIKSTTLRASPHDFAKKK